MKRTLFFVEDAVPVFVAAQNRFTDILKKRQGICADAPRDFTFGRFAFDLITTEVANERPNVVMRVEELGHFLNEHLLGGRLLVVVEVVAAGNVFNRLLHHGVDVPQPLEFLFGFFRVFRACGHR
ncbi:MAG: hypothetical protein R3E58_05885 [Phycisphaerae bacterium]